MELKIKTSEREEIIDITNLIKKEIKTQKGILHIFIPHTTAGITINENADPNIPQDFLNFFEKIVPKGKWLHDKIDGNGDAHIKALITGCSIFIPIEDGKLKLGEWQNIFLCEFDGPRERKVILSFISCD
jgi:secondary thiamine-phosphate synthase enzyme